MEQGIKLTGKERIVYNLGICMEISDIKCMVEEKQVEAFTIHLIPTLLVKNLPGSHGHLD